LISADEARKPTAGFDLQNLDGQRGLDLVLAISLDRVLVELGTATAAVHHFGLLSVGPFWPA